jgi:hypothetical protein
MVTSWSKIVDNKSTDTSKLTIAIAIPYNGSWLPEFIQKTYGPLRYTPLDWCIKNINLSRVPSVSVARDTLVKQALETNCQYILFVDSDMVVEGFDPNIAMQILYNQLNKDSNTKDGKIISALYRAKQSTGFHYAMWIDHEGRDQNGVLKKGFLSVQEWTGNFIEVDVVGLGFCLIDMKVFKEIPGPWFVWNEHGEKSEDFYFCKLAKEYGYNTKIFTDVRLSHLGTLKVKSDGTITTQEG